MGRGWLAAALARVKRYRHRLYAPANGTMTSPEGGQMLRMLMGFSLAFAAATCIDPAIQDRGVLEDARSTSGPEAQPSNPDSAPDPKKVRLDF